LGTAISKFKTDSTTGFSLMYLNEASLRQQLGSLWATVEPCIFDAGSLLPGDSDSRLLEENNFWMLSYKGGK
jgi:hypothetical protein